MFPFRAKVDTPALPAPKFRVGDHVRALRFKLSPIDGVVTHRQWRKTCWLYFVEAKSVFGYNFIAKSGEGNLVKNEHE